MKKGIVYLLFVVMILPMQAVLGQDSSHPLIPQGRSTLSVGPAALAPLVEDAKIRLMLRDGTYVEGKVLNATETELKMKVGHSEPEGRIKKGECNIPTREISAVYLKKKGPAVLPIALGILGGFGGALIGSYAGYESGNTGTLLGLGIGLTTAGATGGALLGAEVAKKTVTINVLPSEIR